MTRHTASNDPSPTFDPCATYDPVKGIDHETLQAYIARGHIERAREARRLFGALRSWITGRASAACDATREAAAGGDPAVCR